MFERFTNRARHVVVLAQEEARGLQHNSIGTEHLLLGLLGEPGGIAAQALDRFGMTLAGTREEVKGIIGIGKGAVSGHIPFTPRAKKTLELALREALQLNHNYIGTEHILLGVIREGEGGGAPVLASVGVDLDQAREALRDADVTGTSDEPPEEAGRRQMLIRVTEDRLTIEATDQVIVRLGRASLDALGDQADPPGAIRGELPEGASLSNVWLALRDSLEDIHRRAGPTAAFAGQVKLKPTEPGTDVA